MLNNEGVHRLFVAAIAHNSRIHHRAARVYVVCADSGDRKTTVVPFVEPQCGEIYHCLDGNTAVGGFCVQINVTDVLDIVVDTDIGEVEIVGDDATLIRKSEYAFDVGSKNLFGKPYGVKICRRESHYAMLEIVVIKDLHGALTLVVNRDALRQVKDREVIIPYLAFVKDILLKIPLLGARIVE